MERSTDDIINELSNNYTKIIPRNELRKYEALNWGDNGIGNRWANKKYNYSVISNKTQKLYSENDEKTIDERILQDFRSENKSIGIIGIFVYSKRTNIETRPINKIISKEIKLKRCVVCGSKNEIVCDHKNDMYNDKLVLQSKTQVISDFQPLCNHCNLQKRQIFKKECKNKKLYPAKNIQVYSIYPFEFPWEKKAFDLNDINCKKDTYWYDPKEFQNKIYLYSTITIPIIKEIKRTLIRIE
jgi:hypothetical protein